jgi:hypothetical protein
MRGKQPTKFSCPSLSRSSLQAVVDIVLGETYEGRTLFSKDSKADVETNAEAMNHVGVLAI